jgi:hypothetical protein
MRQFIIVATAVACGARTTQADDDKAGPRPVPAIQSFPGTVGGEKAHDKNGQKKDEEKKPPTRRERLIQIVKDQNVDWQKRTDALNAMKPGAERDKATKEFPTAGIPFAQKALALAREDENVPESACQVKSVFPRALTYR